MLMRATDTQSLSRARLNGGFSLIEMAVVLLIVGLLLNGLFVALGDSSSNKNRIEASSELESIKEALLGFAQTTGRFPCPAIVGSASIEAPNGGGVCTAEHGFVPSSTLGLQGAADTNGLMVDPWGNPYRYSVSPMLSGGSRAFTTTAGMKSVFAAGALTPLLANQLYCISSMINCAGTLYANTVPVLVFSMGARYAATLTSPLQTENAGNPLVSGYQMPTDRQFVVADYSEEGTNAYDDILVWISPNVMFSRLITAGKLP